MTIDPRLTLCMPTMPSREAFLARAVRWYGLGSRLVAMSDGNSTNMACMLAMARACDTPFVVMCADDDLFLPKGLNAAVEWLAKHDDYALCGGRSLQFKLEGNGPHGKLLWIAPWVQVAHEEIDDTSGRNDGSFERMGNSMFAYAPAAYHVMRTGVARLAFEFIVRNHDLFAQMGNNRPEVNANEWAEHVHTMIPHFMGKSHLVEELYVMRQMHGTDQLAHEQPGTYRHPPLRRLIQRLAPNAFREAQCRVRTGRQYSEFAKVKEFLEHGE